MKKFVPSFIDTHFHAGKDIVPRRVTYEKAVSEYEAQGGAFWLKRHNGQTLSSSRKLRIAGSLVGGTAVLRQSDLADPQPLALVLKEETFRPRPIVSLPTQDVEDFVETVQSKTGKRLLQKVFATVIDNGAVIATGHVPARILMNILPNVADKRSFGKILVTHAFHPMVNADPVIQELYENFGVYFEHTELTVNLKRITSEK
ncbi:DUF6282 family protein, partial [Rathayibacter toxicus]